MNNCQDTFFFRFLDKSTDSSYSGYKATYFASGEQINQIYSEQEKTLTPGAGKVN